jgi:predicted SnoaL-like aldol condensation-catalyzing enzyme
MRSINPSRVATFVAAMSMALSLGYASGVIHQGATQAPAGGASTADQSLANENSADQSSKACVRSRHHLERNKENVEAFYTTAFNDKNPQLAVELYGGEEYIQHNPLAPNGFEAFIEFVENFTGAFPDAHIEIVRVVAECDLVVTHSLATGAEPVYTELGTKLVDIFRLDENGRIVEHWDVGAPISPTSENGNPEV